MKRWQDRGEVQDSDDEELSLGAESPSPERPAKKARLGDSGPDVPDQAIQKGGDDDDGKDEDWLRPKPAITYGRKLGLSAITQLEHPNDQATTCDPTPNNDDARHKPFGTNSGSQPDGVGEKSSVLCSSQTNDSEDLPDVRYLIANRTEGQPVRGEVERYESLFSALSSPLSERAISPSPPPASDGFFLPTLRQTSETAVATDTITPDNEIGSNRGLSTAADSVANRGRNLRTRNEKQLHPYMVDKAQYQQQCRDRGMRPVRVLEAEQPAAETQDPFMNDEESQSSQIIYRNSSSSPALHSASNEMAVIPQQIQNHHYDSEDELPDLSTSMRRRIPGGVQVGSKRRRLFQATRTTMFDSHSRQRNTHGEHQDEFSVPPSPPPTSSEQAPNRQLESGFATFKMPRGLTPLPLPTPQISSDTRHTRVDDEGEMYESGMPSRRSRPSTVSRPQPQGIPMSGSNESSEVDEEIELDERRLQRERKRIKGVLPASWLKIDLRAQRKPGSPSPSRVRRASSSSPERTSPQKGIARRIMSKRPTPSDRPAVFDISDDEADSAPGSRGSSQSPRPMRQMELQFEPSRHRQAKQEFVDVDEMEVDWVDPMFAGPSGRHARQQPKKRQPRIADAFRAAESRNVDFSEERRGLSHVAGTGKARDGHKKKRRKPTMPRPTATRLSIVDVPGQATQSRSSQPQFVRVAIRQARRRADNARHSPTHKHIRLATIEDTESASAILRAWREGTIVPRQTGLDLDHNIATTSASAERSGKSNGSDLRLRTPLAEVSNNVQPRLPSPLQRESTKGKISRVAVAAERGPRMRQSRLHPEVLVQEQSPKALEKPLTTAHQSGKPRRRLIQQPGVRYREAQFESLETEFDQSHRAAAFERRMHLLTEGVSRRAHSTNPTGVQLERFLYGSGSTALPDSHTLSSVSTDNAPKNFEVPGPKEALPHRIRKRRAQRIDADAREYRQPSEPLPIIVDAIDVDQLQGAPPLQPGSVLQGLGPFGMRYPTDFDVLPLSIGTYFHESSFIGSGDFAAALNFAGRDLDNATGRITIHIDGEVLDWGAWTEDVAGGLSRIPRAVSDALHALQNDESSENDQTASLVLSNVDYLLRSATRYLSRCLAFLDPVDRSPCIERIRRCVEDLFEAVEDNASSGRTTFEITVRCLQYALIIANQALRLCNHRLVSTDVATSCRELVDKAAHKLASNILPGCLVELRSFYEDNRHASTREAGIRDSNISVNSIVILHHVLDESAVQPSPFWSIVNQHLSVNKSTLASVAQFDKAWYDVFTLLPALEIDADGIAQVGRRLQRLREDWSLIRKLLERLFDLYAATCTSHGSTINDYVRATLRRCHHLINRWGWWRCESILGTVFDFFARRGLSQLHKEESRGSPRFLEELKDTPSLEVQPEDRSFHIFLKTLASGLQGMRQHGIYTDKKIGAIAWRFIPNHGRTYRKDSEVKQHELDALRNHHDLLCTLYYATPSKHRLRVDLVRSLVDHSASHREACRLSVRSWRNLATFQISTDDDDETLEPFINWYREMLTTTISQYRLARNEVEQDVESARAQGQSIPQRDIDDTIARNQRQISATLVDALAALHRALGCAYSLHKAQHLLAASAFWEVFDLYDPSARRLDSVLQEALAVVQTALHVESSFLPTIESQGNSDESQDYGDSSALQEFASSDPAAQSTAPPTAQILHEPVNQLVSNIFGADAISDDALLTKVVDTWVRLAQKMVSIGRVSWSHYLNDYTSAAWSQLRDTEQRRKFTPYFLAKIVNIGSVDSTEIPALNWWLTSLVEREAMLKFQHILTAALLNCYADEPLLRNLPFTRITNGTFSISLHDFRQRRLSLLSSALSNMRDTYDRFMQENPTALPALRSEYASMLKQIMTAMKTRYQQFDGSDKGSVADTHAQGAYVEFVHQVVSFLQQYTTDICQVDRFFTDSTAFPLPAADPTYVVGRLRAYVPKLAQSGKRKELAGFVRGVSERAAVDGQQQYLVDQLVTAMSGVLEHGDPKAPSLRYVLATAILPAYIENAFSTACSWIVAKPILDACGRCFEEVFYRTKFEDGPSVQAVVEMVSSVLNSMIGAAAHALTYTGLLRLPHVQTTLTALFNAAGQCLTTIRHITRTKPAREENLEGTIVRLVEAVNSIDTILTDAQDFDVPIPMVDDNTERQECHWPDTLDFSRKQLHEELGGKWHAYDGRYFVRRGNGSVEVVVQMEDEEEERVNLLAAVRAFRRSYEAIFPGRGRGVRGRDDCGLGGIVV